MKLLDILLGRSKPVASKSERLLAISTAAVTLTTNLDLTPTGRAGICFRRLSSSQFAEMEQELKGLLRLGDQEAGTTASIRQDEYGFAWVVVEAERFEDLVTTIQVVSLTLEDSGFGAQLLAADFPFRREGNTVHWIYNFKRGAFYPFAPLGRNRDRDNAFEMRLRAVMEKELPIEPDIERWFPLWGAPVG